jgi:PAS domain S-box-containing protein
LNAVENTIRILCLEDAPADMLLIDHTLQEGGLNFISTRVDTREAFMAELERDPPDVILSDRGLPTFDGKAALAVARAKRPEVPFIFVTGSMGEQATIEMFEGGATDYVLKHQLPKLVPAVRRALREAGEREHLRQTVEELRRSEALKAAILETVFDAIIAIDHHGRVEVWNPAAQRIFGYSRAQALDRVVDDLIIPASVRDRFREGLAHYLMTGAGAMLGQPVELTLRRADGTEFPAEVAITQMFMEDPPRFTVLLQDITERKRSELALRESEERFRRLVEQLDQRVRERTAELEVANKELEAFSYSVSHDLRAPLRHIQGYASLLQHAAAASLDETSRQHLNTIARSAKNLGELIDALLGFSRMGRAALKWQPVKLATLVEEARHELRAEIRGRDIDWQIGSLPVVQGDPIMLRQVLINLLSNALKYTRRRERARIEIAATEAADETTVFIRDNGVGFDMAFASKLFGVFQRLHPATEFEGIGIGLANVWRIIRRHEGRVGAEGVVDGGATFWFTLPRKDARKPRARRGSGPRRKSSA